MNAQKLYKKLNDDFEVAKCRDDWSEMEFNEFINKSFGKTYIGLVADNTEEIKKVYTAVFPELGVLNKILSSNQKDCLLFLHHPMIWNISSPKVFTDIPKGYLQKFRDNRISIYTLHVPLDKYGPYSTSMNLARALGIVPEKGFGEYFGVEAGVIGSTKIETASELANKARSVIGHPVKLWSYGDDKIKDGKVALVAGGNTPDDMSNTIRMGINVLVTGVSKPNKDYPLSLETHRLAKVSKVNIIGTTHYSSEKFACIKMTDYFKKLGLDAEFIEGTYDPLDLE